MSHRRTSYKILANSRELRRSQTEAEYKLWGFLRANQLNGVHFRRQHAIGTFVVDFCAPREKLIIELDGSQHLDQEEYDAERSSYLETKGYRVIRFWNGDVINNTDAVIGVILDALEGK